MKKVYAGLTVALATSLGANVYLAGNVELKAAIPAPHCESVSTFVGEAGKSTIESWAVGNLSSDADEKFGEGIVTLADLKAAGLNLRWVDCDHDDDDGTPNIECLNAATLNVCKPGEWTAGQ